MVEMVERRVVCWEVRARRWRKVVEAGVAVGSARSGGRLVVERV